MGKLQLPISNTVSLFWKSDFSDLKPIKTEDGRIIYPLGTVDLGVTNKQANEARENAAIVIWGVISIEQRLNNLIADYLFGPVIGIPKPNRDFFINHILNSDALTLAKKKELIFEISFQENFLVGKEKDEFSKLFSKIIKYRNAFAHGTICVDTKIGTVVNFFSNGHQSHILNDDYWSTLE